MMSICITGCTVAKDDVMSKDIVKSDSVFDSSMQKSSFSQLAFSENGHYQLINGILYYYNDDKLIPVCSKMDCIHKNSECDAYVLDTISNYKAYDLNEDYVLGAGNMIWYDSGNLFLLKRNSSGDYIMKYDKDFHNEEELIFLSKNGQIVGRNLSSLDNAAKVYNGYMYYISRNPSKSSSNIETIACNRVKLEKNAEVELLGTFEFDNAFAKSCCNICIGKNRVYFVAGGVNYNPRSGEKVQYAISYYDFQQDNFCCVLNVNSDSANDVLGKETGIVRSIQNNMCICSDDEENLYIALSQKDNGILKISATGETTRIYSTLPTYDEGSIEELMAKPIEELKKMPYEINSLMGDGKYIYFIENRERGGVLYKMDSQGNICGEYALSVNEEYCNQKKIRGTLRADAKICGIDKEKVIIETDANYIVGLECNAISGREEYKYFRTNAVGIIDIKALENTDGKIRSMYLYDK